MALPFLLTIGAISATTFGATKGYKGYQTKSAADDIFERTQRRYKSRKEDFDSATKESSSKLELLGEKELMISSQFKEFDAIAKKLLAKLNQYGHKKIELSIPEHKLNKIEKLSITATEFLATAVSAGVSGAAAGFAVYGGVMTFSAASTGTSIASLSGISAYNATMAAIGSSSLAAGRLGMTAGRLGMTAGRLGMASRAALLGGAIAAPIIAIAGWAYNSHAEEALKNALKVKEQVQDAVLKMDMAEEHLSEINKYVDKLYQAITEIHEVFTKYFDILKTVNIEKKYGLPIDKSEETLRMIQNGYMLAAIITDIITTPLFKPVTNEQGEAVVTEEGIQLETDENGMNTLNTEALDAVLNTPEQRFAAA